MPKNAERTAVAPEKVVRVVKHALTAKSPKARYIVGLEAYLMIGFFSLVPTRLADTMMRRGVDLLARLT